MRKRRSAKAKFTVLLLVLSVLLSCCSTGKDAEKETDQSVPGESTVQADESVSTTQLQQMESTDESNQASSEEAEQTESTDESEQASLEETEQTVENTEKIENQNEPYAIDFSVRLESCGTIDQYHGAVLRNEDETQTLLTPLGENILGASYHNIDSTKFDDGSLYYYIYDYNNLPNYCGLVTEECEILIPCEAAIIKHRTNRYLEVVYAQGVVTNEADAYLFAYSPESFADFQLEPEEGDALYDGYSVIYDLQMRRFVPNIRIDDNSCSFYFLENHIYSSQDQCVYSSDGTIVAESSFSPSYGYFIERAEEGDGYVIYDENMSLVKELPFRPSKIYAGATLFAKADDEDPHKYYVADAEGNPISDIYFRYPPTQYNNFICGTNEDDAEAIMDLSGRLIVDFDENINFASEHIYGFLQLHMKDRSYSLVYPNGDVVHFDDTFSGFTHWKDNGNNSYSCFVLEDQDYTLTLNDVSWISNLNDTMIVVQDSESGLYGVYSVIDGSKLLDTKYERITNNGNYVFAETADGCEVYHCIEE